MVARDPKGYVPNREGVLITGCSSGIGRATAIHLARRGFTVFATVRKQADAESLRGLNEASGTTPTLIPICPLDLTRLEQIPDMMETVTKELERRGKEGLYALINSAGGGSVAPIELMDLDGFRTELQARVLGSVAMVQACLPMIRRARGRIVWIVTPATLPTPYVTSIHACDFAVSCIARTLEIELKPWKIPNIMIRCGGAKTAASLRTDAELEASFKTWPPERSALYEPALRQWQGDMAEFDAKRTEPERVAEVVFKALCAQEPERRYSIGHMARAAAFLESLPQPVVDWILAKRFKTP
jgi:NAD(P)-dependent dehydrogenase (short-subunit alcohol dehydrogenase family)